MKYRYFANILAHIEYEIEAPDRETADELAEERLMGIDRAEFEETGWEIGFMPKNNPHSWEEVAACGDLT